MIRRGEEMVTEIRERMRGGEGQVEITHLLSPGDYQGNMRLCARLTLLAGCSIGHHDHQHEEEIFYCLSGEGELSGEPGEPMQILRAGDSAICRAGESHSIRNGSQEPLVLVAVILLTP